MLAPSNSKFGPLGIREFEVFDLPYILPDLKTLRKVTEGPLGLRLLKLLDSKGITGLAYWDNGFKQMSANKKLVAPADYQGVKFRIQSSRVLQAQFKALGSLPQVMAFSEVYQALQTGVVDGQENTWSNIYTQKMHEVQKYITETNHGYIGYVVIVNKKFWDDLPADIRDQLVEGDEGSDRLQQRAVAEGERRRARRDQEERQERDHQAHAGAGRGDAQGDGAGLQGRRKPRRPAADRRVPEGIQEHDELARRTECLRTNLNEI